MLFRMAMPVPLNAEENPEEYVYHINDDEYQEGLEERRFIIQNYFRNNEEIHNQL